MNKFKFFIFLLFFSAAFQKSSAQSAAIDSLNHLFNTTKEDSTKVIALSELSVEYAETDLPKSLIYAKQALKLASKIEYNKGLAWVYTNYGIIYSIRGENDKAIENYQSALKYLQPKDKQLNAKIWANLGVAYNSKGDYAIAAKLFFKALKVDEEIGNLYGIASIYNCLGEIYFAKKEYAKSIQYFYKALELRKKNPNDKREIFSSLNGLGAAYDNFGKKDSALYYYNIALDLSKQAKLSPYTQATILFNIGTLYNDLKNTKLALQYNLQALDIYNKTGGFPEEVVVLSNIGEIFMEEKKYDKALSYLKNALELEEKFDNKETFKIILGDLAELYSRMGNYEQALRYYQKCMTMKDSLFNENVSKEVAEMENKYQLGKKQKENELLSEKNKTQELKLNKNRYITYGSISLLLLILIIAILFVKQTRLKAKNKQIILEQKLLHAQMNPHFIFNCINSIQRFVLNNEKNTAYNYMSKFARLMRNVLDNSKQETLSVRQELETLSMYIELEALRFKTKFNYKILIDEKVDQNIEIPPMLVQPFVENAIWHGLMTKENQGELLIELIGGYNSLKFIVEDNGIGISSSSKLKSSTSSHKSHGMKLTQERLDGIKQLSKKNLSVNIMDISEHFPGRTGTRVEITIPDMREIEYSRN